MTPLVVALVPWGFGPSPSAHAVGDGVVVQARADAFSSGVAGGRGGIQASMADRVTVGLEAVHGASWALCPDCRVSAVTGTARVMAVNHPAFHAAMWGHGTATLGVPEALAGVAVEGGSRDLRFDASTPLASTTFLLTTLRIGPEVGVMARWSDTHATRFAVVGLEPGVGLQHRWHVASAIELEPSLRLGEEGLGVGLAVRATL